MSRSSVSKKAVSALIFSATVFACAGAQVVALAADKAFR
jgi:hypothetical protein